MRVYVTQYTDHCKIGTKDDIVGFVWRAKFDHDRRRLVGTEAPKFENWVHVTVFRRELLEMSMQRMQWYKG